MTLSKYNREIIRKLIHIITGAIFIASALIFKDINVIFWVGIFLLIPFSIFYFTTLWFSHTKIGVLSQGLVEREVGHHTYGIGGISYVLGVLISYIIFGFNPGIVIMSIIVLSFGDGFASYIGMRFGRLKLNIEGHTKTIEGTLAGIVASTLIGSIFIDFITALVVSVLAMTIEMVGIKVRGKEIPDNLYLPVVAGIIMYIFITFR